MMCTPKWSYIKISPRTAMPTSDFQNAVMKKEKKTSLQPKQGHILKGLNNNIVQTVKQKKCTCPLFLYISGVVITNTKHVIINNQSPLAKELRLDMRYLIFQNTPFMTVSEWVQSVDCRTGCSLLRNSRYVFGSLPQLNSDIYY